MPEIKDNVTTGMFRYLIRAMLLLAKKETKEAGMNGWATTVISGLVLVVAYMQWRTAHQKVMLDLFERRLQVFKDVREIASRGADRSTFSDPGLPNDVIAHARYIFGPEVLAIISDIYNHCTARDIGTLQPGALDRDYQRFLVAIDPYLRMDQRKVRTPAEWLKDKNAKRLSYADEHQR